MIFKTVIVKVGIFGTTWICEFTYSTVSLLNLNATLLTTVSRLNLNVDEN